MPFSTQYMRSCVCAGAVDVTGYSEELTKEHKRVYPKGGVFAFSFQ